MNNNGSSTIFSSRKISYWYRIQSFFTRARIVWFGMIHVPEIAAAKKIVNSLLSRYYTRIWWSLCLGEVMLNGQDWTTSVKWCIQYAAYCMQYTRTNGVSEDSNLYKLWIGLTETYSPSAIKHPRPAYGPSVKTTFCFLHSILQALYYSWVTGCVSFLWNLLYSDSLSVNLL